MLQTHGLRFSARGTLGTHVLVVAALRVYVWLPSRVASTGACPGSGGNEAMDHESAWEGRVSSRLSGSDSVFVMDGVTVDVPSDPRDDARGPISSKSAELAKLEPSRRRERCW